MELFSLEEKVAHVAGRPFRLLGINTCKPLAPPYSPDLRRRSLNVWVSEVGAAKLAATIKIQDSPDFDLKASAGD